jgi:hypothetical protein
LQDAKEATAEKKLFATILVFMRVADV